MQTTETQYTVKSYSKDQKKSENLTAILYFLTPVGISYITWPNCYIENSHASDFGEYWITWWNKNSKTSIMKNSYLSTINVMQSAWSTLITFFLTTLIAGLYEKCIIGVLSGEPIKICIPGGKSAARNVSLPIRQNFFPFLLSFSTWFTRLI